jgi:flagellar protein FlgJ
MYEDMLYDEYARELTKNANFGMAEQAYRQLTGQR